MAATRKPSDGKQPIDASDVPFEQLLERIETAVGKLEQGETPLEESLQVYEQGSALIREAQQRLGRMEAKVEELTAEDETNSDNP